MTQAFVIVDVQYDFLPGGALPVAEGDRLAPLINALMPHFDLVVATQDAHPQDHVSFAASHPGQAIGAVIDADGLEQRLWPVHCVIGSRGAELVHDLDRRRVARVFAKGSQSGIDSYSGFFDNGRRAATGLGDYLREHKIDEVFVVGLALDYCVRATAIDAASLGFRTTVILDACRAVDPSPSGIDATLAALAAAGVHIAYSRQWLGEDDPPIAAATLPSGTPVMTDRESPPRLLAEGRFLRLVVKNGWEYVERANASGVVAIAAVNAAGALILTEQFRPPIACQSIELPAGLVGDTAGDEDELLIVAAERELLEETGYRAERLVFLTHGPNSGGLTSETTMLFLAVDVQKVAAGGGVEHESILVHEIPLAEVDAWLLAQQDAGKLIDPKVYVALYFLASPRAREAVERHQAGKGK